MITDIRKDALLNEYKGSMFEYLVALNLARESKLEKDFLNSLNQNHFEVLAQQEAFIRNYKPDLLINLQNYAHATALALLKDNITQLEVVGKSLSSQKDDYSEVDLILKTKKSSSFISLKLSKKNAYVNTKSAGVKSIFKKYFESVKIQNEFDLFFNHQFELFSRKLHEIYDISFDSKFLNWSEAKLPVLPGELDKGREDLLDFYHNINKTIYNYFLKFYQDNPENFCKNLRPLIGFSHENITQVICYHSDNTCNVILIKDKDISDICFKLNPSNFEIQTKDFSLQIRLKPMNTFINPSYKINCSVKFS